MGIFGKPNVQKLEAKKDVDGLIKVLKHKDSSVRREAAMVLGKIADARAVEALIEALKHEPDDSVLKEAKVALGEIGEPAIEPLIEVFIEKYERDDFGLKEGLKPVIDDSLVDEHFLFRHVVNALEKIGTAVEPLICTLKARPPGPKNSVAAMVLGKIGDARVARC